MALPGQVTSGESEGELVRCERSSCGFGLLPLACLSSIRVLGDGDSNSAAAGFHFAAYLQKFPSWFWTSETSARTLEVTGFYFN